MTTNKEVAAKQKELLFPCVTTYYEEPIAFERGEGARLWDVEGTEYLDFFGGILTVSLGHAEPRVTDAVVAQAKKLVHTSALYPIPAQVAAAERLIQISPIKGKQKAFFTSSGTEADETALVLAKVFTKTTEVIALRHSYSGRTLVAMTNTAHAKYRALPAQVPGTVHAHAPYCYRCPYGATPTNCGLRCAEDLEELIATCTTGRPAAFFAEPILGVGGFITPPEEYFKVAVGIVKKHGGLFICDEVQTGFGRTGDVWNGIEHYGVEPDLVSYAKGIANGYPMGATLARAEIADAFTAGSIATFGGNPISATAATATMAVMSDERIPERASRLGARLRGRLEQMKEKYPVVGDVRGMGLMQALELVEDRATKKPAPAATNRFAEACKQRKLLVGKGGLYGNTVRIAPPMLIGEAEIDAACDIMDAALAETTI
ncbi:MAG: aspartate aminotransferase family protein [Kofleriaceae bacterium]|nr:MAG: aspartate aminotransferase family protein [Kofleriaceae bacterium]MBZ0235951.1 aspartate aminotransferase family protein [Kofleriaceae bacterium]